MCRFVWKEEAMSVRDNEAVHIAIIYATIDANVLPVPVVRNSLFIRGVVLR